MEKHNPADGDDCCLVSTYQTHCTQLPKPAAHAIAIGKDPGSVRGTEWIPITHTASFNTTLASSQSARYAVLIAVIRRMPSLIALLSSKRTLREMSSKVFDFAIACDSDEQCSHRREKPRVGCGPRLLNSRGNQNLCHAFANGTARASQSCERGDQYSCSQPQPKRTMTNMNRATHHLG